MPRVIKMTKTKVAEMINVSRWEVRARDGDQGGIRISRDSCVEMFKLWESSCVSRRLGMRYAWASLDIYWVRCDILRC